MYIKVEVVAEARQEILRKINPDSFTISVREKAERNQANRRVLQLIRQEFGKQRIIVKIISGHHSSHKIISVDVIGKHQ